MKISKKHVALKQLRDGMILAEPIYDIDGKTLFSEGLRLNEKRIKRIEALDMIYVVILSNDYEEDQVNDSIVRETPIRDIIKDKANFRKQILLNETREDAKNVVENVFQEVMDDGTVKTAKIKRIVEAVIEAIMYDDQVVLNLSNLSTIDDYMLSHSVNVCVMTLITGIVLGFSQEKLVKLGIGALIHDIGKMLVPQEILNKPSKLTSEEYSLVKQHTVYGHKILKDTLKYDFETAAIALSHHERLDGKGYPSGLSSNDIPIFAKVVSVTDVFDALTTNRVYCERVSYYKGIEYLLEHAGTQFDEDIVKKFITVIGFYPLGLQVKLNTGDIGQVIKKNKKQPVLKIVIDANGKKLDNYYEIDMHKNPTISIIDINMKKKSTS